MTGPVRKGLGTTFRIGRALAVLPGKSTRFAWASFRCSYTHKRSPTILSCLGNRLFRCIKGYAHKGEALQDLYRIYGPVWQASKFLYNFGYILGPDSIPLAKAYV